MPLVSSGVILFVIIGRPAYICIASPLMISPLWAIARSIANCSSSEGVVVMVLRGANLGFACAGCAKHDDERVLRRFGGHYEAFEKSKR